MACVVDWDSVCLVCLQKSESHYIFEKDEETGLSIAEKIMKCSDFLIQKNTGQPSNICLQCLNDLNIAFKFRQNCEQSSSIINAILSQDNRELEVSGVRIKLPSGLKVMKKNAPEIILPNIPEIIESPEKTEEPKFDVYQCKTIQEPNDFEDENDYMDSTEVLEDLEDEEANETFENVVEEIQNIEVITEQNDVKPLTPEHLSFVEPEKRGRGRPKKIHNGETDKEYSKHLGKKPVKPIPNRRNKKSPEIKPAKICEICGNSYKFQHALNSHMRRHRNERPFNCDFCDKAFVSAVELRRHMRVHTGQKPYECSYCNRRFSDYGSRIKHERTHTGERPYTCSTCGKTFAYAHVLTVHMRIHTGEKKYLCSDCGRGFTKKSYLENHMSHHHNITEDIKKDDEIKAVDTISYTKQYEDLQISSYDCVPDPNTYIELKLEKNEEQIF